MTTYGAYDAGLPCRNPSCKSHGHPHPNCQCYGDMADGGEAEPFCASNRPHKPGCKYFDDGGEVVPANQVTPDQPDSDVVPANQVTPDDLGEVVPDDQVTPDSQKYGTPIQQAGAALEGAAQGIAGPLATAAELGASKLGVPGVSAEDIAGRAEENPWIHGLSEAGGIGAGLLTGTGAPGLAMKAGEGIANLSRFGKIGASVINGMLTNGLLTGSDEITKSLIGQGDPTDAVSNVLISMGAGGLFGGATGSLSGGISGALDAKIGLRARAFMSGMGFASDMPEIAQRTGVNQEMKNLFSDDGLGEAYKHYLAGQNFVDNTIRKAVDGAIETGGLLLGAGSGSETGAITGVLGSKIVDKVCGPWLTDRAQTTVQKYVAPIFLRAMPRLVENGGIEMTNTFGGLLDHAGKIAKGANMLEKSVNGLFTSGASPAVEAADIRKRDMLDDYIQSGGIGQNVLEQQYQDNNPVGAASAGGYAEGGIVKPLKPVEAPKSMTEPVLDQFHHIAEVLPEHNIMLQTARSRISKYLSNLRPSENAPHLAFDDPPDQTEKKKSYERALDLANKPLSILDKVKRGTIEPEHVSHLNAMYPEVSQTLQKQITKKITEAQLKNEKPSYTVRQGLSLLLGTPLSGEMTPQGIAAAQATFAPKQPPQQPAQSVTKNKKNTSSLSKSSQAFLTGNQASTARQQKSS